MEAKDKEIIYKLKVPVKWMEGVVKEVKFTTPKAKHLKGIDMQKMNADEIILICGRISDLPSPFFDEIDWKDLIGVTDIITGFLPDSQKTGKNA